jgi:hypothetical protein
LPFTYIKELAKLFWWILNQKSNQGAHMLYLELHHALEQKETHKIQTAILTAFWSLSNHYILRKHPTSIFYRIAKIY